MALSQTPFLQPAPAGNGINLQMLINVLRHLRCMPGLCLGWGCCVPARGSSHLWAGVSGAASAAVWSRKKGGIADPAEANQLGETRQELEHCEDGVIPVSAWLPASWLCIL